MIPLLPGGPMSCQSTPGSHYGDSPCLEAHTVKEIRSP
ncbi:unnamed protein product [Staurois parvus]|uniref:Uncharacterized protein n=1 Tax=Staurois parvus TaxID=386267 RepID=A0ABN9HRT2_9NEOB|nr:unnamed protein product [Staurois parvus]